MFECNLDARGKAARFLGGLAAIFGSLILAGLLATDVLTVSMGWYGVAGGIFGGAFAILKHERAGASCAPLASRRRCDLAGLGTLKASRRVDRLWQHNVWTAKPVRPRLKRTSLNESTP